MPGAIPTLFVNQPSLSSPPDVVAYLLRFMATNPGWTSSQIEASLLSMRKFVFKHTEDIAVLPGAIQAVLDAAVKRYFPNYNAVVLGKRVTETRYSLQISVTDALGASVLSTDDFVIDNGEFKLVSEIRNVAKED